MICLLEYIFSDSIAMLEQMSPELSPPLPALPPFSFVLSEDRALGDTAAGFLRHENHLEFQPHEIRMLTRKALFNISDNVNTQNDEHIHHLEKPSEIIILCHQHSSSTKIAHGSTGASRPLAGSAPSCAFSFRAMGRLNM
jgi:hypothetical protein